MAPEGVMIPCEHSKGFTSAEEEMFRGCGLDKTFTSLISGAAGGDIGISHPNRDYSTIWYRYNDLKNHARSQVHRINTLK